MMAIILVYIYDHYHRINFTALKGETENCMRQDIHSSGILHDVKKFLKTGLIGCTKTSVQKYHSLLNNVPEEHRSHLHCSRSMKLYMRQTYFWTLCTMQV